MYVYWLHVVLRAFMHSRIAVASEMDLIFWIKDSSFAVLIQLCSHVDSEMTSYLHSFQHIQITDAIHVHKLLEARCYLLLQVVRALVLYNMPKQRIGGGI